MKTMKAVRIHSYGGQEALIYEDAPLPQVGDDDLLIRVHATSVNPFDWKVRQGYLTGWINYSFPLILGWDVSGVVEATGRGVTGFSAGDEVYGRADIVRDGASAEYIAVRSSAVVRKPQSVDHLHAAAIPHAALAAWNSLANGTGLAPGQRVLIHGAAGGVGTFAVQFAKQRGAQIIGTASAHNREFLLQLGVDEVIDYNTTRFEDVVHDADVVLDNIGSDTLQRSYEVVKPGGIVVSLVEPPSEEKAEERGIRVKFATAEANPEVLTQIAAMVDAGQVKPVVSVVFPLQKLHEAHALSESYHARGKIAVKVVE